MYHFISEAVKIREKMQPLSTGERLNKNHTILYKISRCLTNVEALLTKIKQYDLHDIK